MITSEIYQQEIVGRQNKELSRNLAYRIKVRERANRDAVYRAALRSSCASDVLYFFNTFAWLHEPRPLFLNGVRLSAKVPFITWPVQDREILKIRNALGKRDVGVEKSRDEGATWIAIWLAVQDFLFEDLSNIGMVSRNQDSVYKGGDSSTLFWKLDWALASLPPWMAGVKGRDYVRKISNLTLENKVRHNVIAGYPATEELGASGRSSWFLLDELSRFPRPKDEIAVDSVRSVTNSRLVISTPMGASGAYYEFMTRPSNVLKVVLDWKDDPRKNRGLYRLKEGIPTAVDAGNPLTEEYANNDKSVQSLLKRLQSKGFPLTGVIRSPWYDNECDRPGATPESIAREVDHSFGGSRQRVFTDAVLQKIDSTVDEPRAVGEFIYNKETLEATWSGDPQGKWKIWCPFDDAGKPATHKYIVAADASLGRASAYTSNSAIQVIDLNTGEQVAEFAANDIGQSDLADLMIAVAKFFHEAMIAWESNFSSAIGTRVIFRQYHRVFHRAVLYSTRKRSKKDRQMGWFTNKDTKQVMFSELKVALLESRIVARSNEFKRECSQYVMDGDKIEHETRRDDPTHGDRVIAFGVGLMAALLEKILVSKPKVVPDPPKRRTFGDLMDFIKERDERSSEDDWQESVPGYSEGPQEVEVCW